MAGEPRRAYIIDASSWISIEGDPAHNRILYFVGRLIEEGRVLTPPEAWSEVKQCPQVEAWLAQYDGSFVRRINDVEYLLLVGQVVHRFSAMAGARRRKERADQYVVGMAAHLNRITNPTEFVAVSEESVATRKSRKIETACAAFGVKHTCLRDMLREEFADEW